MPRSLLMAARVPLIVAGALALAACGRAPRPEALLTGETMGSAWTVKLAGDLPADEGTLRAGVQAQFDAVDAALSTYKTDSALSRFNAAPDDDWQHLDAELFAVLRYALELAAISEGAYDVTIAPLVDLWGFGPAPRRDAPPTEEQIAAARARVGWQQIELDVAQGSARRPPGVRIDLSSLGKGRGVDRVAGWLEAQGVHDYLIDLSGKLRAGGRNAQGTAWHVAVEKPEADDPSGQPNITREVVALQDDAIATAGDYRRFFESGGSHFSHLIDPVSGRPIDRTTGSATARANDCMSADAWATLLTLVTPDRAIVLANQHQVPALVITREGSALRFLHSDRWQAAAMPPAAVTSN